MQRLGALMISPSITGHFGPGLSRPEVVSALGHFSLSCFDPGSFRPNSVGRFGLICHEPSSRVALGGMGCGILGKGTDVWYCKVESWRSLMG